MNSKINISEAIDLIAKLVGIAAGIGLLCSIIYDWAFFSVFHISFSTLPTTLSDHVRSALEWFPRALFIAFFAVAFEFITIRIEGGMSEDEIIARSSNSEKTRKFRNRPIRLMLNMWPFGIILYLITGDLVFGILPISLILLWYRISLWIFNHPGIRQRFSIAVFTAFLAVPPIGIYLYWGGHSDALSDLRQTKSYYAVVSTSKPTPIQGTLVRTFDRGIFFLPTNSKQIDFIQWSDIDELEYLHNSSVYKGIFCQWHVLKPICKIISNMYSGPNKMEPQKSSSKSTKVKPVPSASNPKNTER